ncbi:MAG: hypothetical protein ACEQSB_05840 [Undibacterium sp.]
MEDIMPEPVIPRPVKNRKKWLIRATIVVVLGIGIFFLWWLFNRPSQGVITAGEVPQKTDFSDPAHRKRYQGKYFTFTYPYDFDRREENENVKPPLLERLFLARNDIEGRKIALTLQDNSGNSFEEYSSFRIRRADPTVYREETIERNGENITLFTKETIVFEVAAFFHRGNRVFSLVVSSPTTENGLREEVFAALDSFEWKGE